MNKKILAGIVAGVLILVCGGLWLYNGIMYYTLEIPEKDKIAKIIFKYAGGDMYEITDTDVIDEFVDSIDGISFKRERSLADSTWSSSSISFLDKEDKIIYSIQISGENAIIHGDEPYRYISEKKYKLDILYDVGTFIKNVHTDSED